MPSTYEKQDTIVDVAGTKEAYKPSHPGLFEVFYAEGSFNSQLVASQDFKQGQIICKIEGTEPGPKRYSSVQVSKDSHIELNSDLVFLNHSCDPSVTLDTDEMKLIAAKDIKKGDALTFFYPSSEWEMDQPFPCWCGSTKCCKSIQGAKFLSTKVIDQYYVASHIRELLKERDEAQDSK
ncbi:hypothetical protein BX616_010820 [Lobosporangium transversale]|uniref:SET domain-containing protein n=1 Tax=Lobosporangium transversale TaxID=64571 RepID=A0A1Y2GKU4_9FUNG|nr:hypothetical protein BCR41DRAFT_356343 [Lobosporangium transversale]KAF9910624.1 hypothetical protein BX616_010820 [Lobosporangium transversale]ORZ12586.1 hypothetical protein BCR41DRAFT_356343 [Lobosporangium transversale]|eukprot:XP_021880205.1 hypothetical protein BCR41DRAFT_356343 [Lobosporangium transversale]